jgi:hypothetical protein
MKIIGEDQSEVAVDGESYFILLLRGLWWLLVPQLLWVGNIGLLGISL